MRVHLITLRMHPLLKWFSGEKERKQTCFEHLRCSSLDKMCEVPHISSSSVTIVALQVKQTRVEEVKPPAWSHTAGCGRRNPCLLDSKINSRQVPTLVQGTQMRDTPCEKMWAANRRLSPLNVHLCNAFKNTLQADKAQWGCHLNFFTSGVPSNSCKVIQWNNPFGRRQEQTSGSPSLMSCVNLSKFLNLSGPWLPCL